MLGSQVAAEGRVQRPVSHLAPALPPGKLKLVLICVPEAQWEGSDDLWLAVPHPWQDRLDPGPRPWLGTPNPIQGRSAPTRRAPVGTGTPPVSAKGPTSSAGWSPFHRLIDATRPTAAGLQEEHLEWISSKGSLLT